MEMIGFCRLQLFLKMQPDDAADVAVIHQHQWMTFGKDIFEALGNAAAEKLQAKERRGTFPVKSHCDGLASMQQIQPAKGVKRCIAHGFLGEIILIQRKLGSNDGDVAYGNRVFRGDKDRIATDLNRVLRGADNGGANARRGFHDKQAQIAHALMNFIWRTMVRDHRSSSWSRL